MILIISLLKYENEAILANNSFSINLVLINSTFLYSH